MTSRSWATRMASVVRQFQKLMKEQEEEDLVIFDKATGLRIDVIGLCKGVHSAEFTIIRHGEETGVFRTTEIATGNDL